MASWDLDQTADDLQRAALEPGAWETVLETLCETVGAHGAVLISTDHRVPGPPVTPSIRPMIDEYFQQGWNLRDIRFRGASTALRRGVTVDQDFVSPEEIQRSPYYNDWLHRHNCRYFAAIAALSGDTFWCISIQRSIKQGLFDVEEARRLSTLTRSFTDAVALSRQFGMAHVLGMADALQQTRQAAILLDEGGRLLAANALAESMMGDGIDVSRRTLVFHDRESQSTFEKLFSQAISPTMKEGPLETTGSIRTRSGVNISVRAVVLRGWARFTFTQASVLLLLGRRRSRDNAPELLKKSFTLTPAEAKLAAALAEGQSLSEIAEILNITYHTARVHLRSIFQKTEVNRQGKLVALLRRTLDG